jgi:hypothetical protein
VFVTVCFGPLRGPCPSRLDEEKEWKAAKEREKAVAWAEPGGVPLPPAPPTRSFSSSFLYCCTPSGWQELVAAAAMVALGFGLGFAAAGRRR